MPSNITKLYINQEPYETSNYYCHLIKHRPQEQPTEEKAPQPGKICLSSIKTGLAHPALLVSAGITLVFASMEVKAIAIVRFIVSGLNWVILADIKKFSLFSKQLNKIFRFCMIFYQ